MLWTSCTIGASAAVASAMTKNRVPHIFERQRASAKWTRARARQRLNGGATYLSDTIADDVIERLEFMRFEPGSARVVGDASGGLSAHFLSKGTTAETGLLGEFDEEGIGPLGEFDFIGYLLGLGMVNDLPGALIRARNELKSGGLLIASFPGAGSLPTLRQITLAADDDRPAARIHPQVDSRAGSALLERAGFARQVVDTYPIKVRFSSLERLVNDLRDHGLTSSLASPAPPLTLTSLERARAAFDQLREDDGKVTETFEILVLTGWR